MEVAVAIVVILAVLVLVAVLVQRRRRAGGVISVETRPRAWQRRGTGRRT